MNDLYIVAWGWVASSFVGIMIIILYSIGNHLHYKYGYEKMFYHPEIKRIIKASFTVAVLSWIGIMLVALLLILVYLEDKYNI